MIEGLPVEIKLHLLGLIPSLRLVSRSFYVLYNDLFFTQIIKEFGVNITETLQKIQPYLKEYVKYLDDIRRIPRVMIASELRLKDAPTLDSEYIRDSWQYIYSILKNKRLFITSGDYVSDEQNHQQSLTSNAIHIDKSYLLNFHKSCYLTPGKYNLNIGLKIKSGNGLGTTKFEICYMSQGTEIKKTCYLPTNVHEILPKDEFCIVKVFEFEIDQADVNDVNNLINVALNIEETGMNLKTGFTVYFADFSLPSLLFNQYDLFFYSISDDFISLPAMEIYKVINAIDMKEDIEQFKALSIDRKKVKLDQHYERVFKFNNQYQRNLFYSKFGHNYDENSIKLKLPTIQKI